MFALIVGHKMMGVSCMTERDEARMYQVSDTKTGSSTAHFLLEKNKPIFRLEARSGAKDALRILGTHLEMPYFLQESSSGQRWWAFKITVHLIVFASTGYLGSYAAVLEPRIAS